MRLGKFQRLLRWLCPVDPCAGAALTVKRSPYEIIAICRGADAASVGQIIGQQLMDLPGAKHVVLHAPQSPGCFMQITIRIWCAVSERAVLVRLVSRLGLEKAVRSVRWESRPTIIAN
jgi:hypothetical protein